MADRRATLLSAAPTLLDLLAVHPDLPGTDLSALQVLFTGGMTVTPAFVDRVESVFGARLSITFGMTETCGAVLQTAPTDPDRIRRETVGAPLAGTDVRIAGPDGAAVPPGDAGELWVRGERITRGYLDDPAATAETIDADGWLHTGDLAEMDDDGACRVVGRLKDMIKTGGENVSPVEVEELLVQHPDVDRAAVVGVPDDRWGELVVAFVVPAAGPRSRPRGPDRLLPGPACRRSRCPAAVARRRRPADDGVGQGATGGAAPDGRRGPASGAVAGPGHRPVRDVLTRSDRPQGRHCQGCSTIAGVSASAMVEQHPRSRPAGSVGSDGRGQGHRRDVVGHLQRGAGGGDDLVGGDAGRDLAQHEPVVGDVDDGEVGDDPVDAGLAGQRQGALLDDLRATRRGRRAPS